MRASHPTIRRLTLAAAAVSLVAAAGCKRPGGQQIVLTKDQEQQIAEHVLAAPPAMEHKVDASFEDKITLLGYDLKGAPATRGGKLDLTMYFRVDQPLHGDWKIFVHFEAPGEKRQPFDHYGVGGLYPPAMWKKGEIVKDTITIDVPGDWPQKPSQLLIGFFDWGAWSKAQQNRRLKVTKAPEGRVLPDDRLLLTTVEVAGGAAGGAGLERPPRVAPVAATYTAGPASAAPTLDGKLDDAAWQAARTLSGFRQPDSQAANPAFATTARLTWDAQNLYFAAATRDDEIRNDHKDNDSTLWEGDVIELFLQVPGKPGEYVELQFAPNGARFDARFTSHRQPAWAEAAKFDSGVQHAVTVEGTVNAEGEADRAWTVEAAIPWKGLGLDGAPAPGTRLAANIYRIDNKGTHDVRYMATWAPVGTDFHKLDGAGTIVIAAEAGAAPAVLPGAPKP